MKKIKQKNKRTRRQNKRITPSSNKSKCLKWIVKKNTTYVIKMVGKIYFQESKEEPFKACVKKQDAKKNG